LFRDVEFSIIAKYLKLAVCGKGSLHLVALKESAHVQNGEGGFVSFCTVL
jgi:hypothetical protein